MPSSKQSNTNTLITAQLSASEWEAVQLMRVRATTDSEMVYVPRAAYALLESTAMESITAARKAEKLTQKLTANADILDYLLGQLRVV